MAAIILKKGKKRQRIRWYRLLCLIFLSFFVVNTAGACELKSGWEPWFPFQYRDKSTGELAGLDIEIFRAIFRTMPCDLKFMKTHWKAQLLRLQNGSLDLCLGASYLAERAKYAYYSEPYRTEKVKLYVLKGKSKEYHFSSLADISGTSFRLGVTQEYYYGEEYEKLSKDPVFRNNISEIKVDEVHLKKLMAGRIEGFLMDHIAARTKIVKLNLQDKIETYPMDIYQCDIHVLFSKKNVKPKTVELFNKKLRQFMKSSEYNVILEKQR